MFDLSRYLLDEGEDTGPYPRYASRRLAEPVLVEVDIERLLPGPTVRWCRGEPIWLHRAGLPLDPAPGLLYAWIRTTRGSWCALVSLELRSENGRLRVSLPGQLVPAAALRRLPAGAPDTPTRFTVPGR
jgi:hypothetical protein